MTLKTMLKLTAANYFIRIDEVESILFFDNYDQDYLTWDEAFVKYTNLPTIQEAQSVVMNILNDSPFWVTGGDHSQHAVAYNSRAGGFYYYDKNLHYGVRTVRRWVK